MMSWSPGMSGISDWLFLVSHAFRSVLSIKARYFVVYTGVQLIISSLFFIYHGLYLKLAVTAQYELKVFCS